MAGSAKPDSSTRCVCFPLGGAGVSRARLASGLCRLWGRQWLLAPARIRARRPHPVRPADVACLLSASNRRADIVRATPILFLSRDGDGRKRCSGGHRQGTIRSSTESRRAKSRGLPDRYMEHLARHFHAADDRLRWRETRNGPAESPKPGNNWRPMPINFFSARVAPGLRTQTFAGDQSWPVQPSGSASYRATGERRLYRAKSGEKPAIDYVRRLCPRITSRSRQAADLSIRKASQESENRADGLTARRCVNDTGSPSLPVSRTIRNRRNCLTLSPRPPDQSGDPAASYRIGAVF